MVCLVGRKLSALTFHRTLYIGFMSAVEIGFEFTDEKTRLSDLSPLYSQQSQLERELYTGHLYWPMPFTG